MTGSQAVKRILYITMSNLGDAVMGLPAFDFLRRECPSARITVVAAPGTRCLFEHHPDVAELLVFDKHAPLKDKIALYQRLKKGDFDVIVDLKNTFYRWALRSPRKSPGHNRYPSFIRHYYQKHLFKAVSALRGPSVSAEEFKGLDGPRNPSFISHKDAAALAALLEARGVVRGEELAVFVPGSRSNLKRWSVQGYAEVVREIQKKYGKRVVIAGDQGDEAFVKDICARLDVPAVDLCCRTNLGMLCALILRAALVIGSDSGALQVASYLDRPVIGIYGPTDYRHYGPWSSRGIAVRKNVLCAPCSRSQCAAGTRACIQTIRPFDVLLAVRLMLEGREERFSDDRYRRILLVRTDRIGDVVLSTPVIKALREHYPSSFIAMMVSVATREVVEGNPYLDQVIVFDKDRAQQGLWATLKFSRYLSGFSFDVAVVLHPTFRVHLVTFLAGIRERIGYDRKGSFFLTRRLEHKKQEGLKHEIEYNFDLLASLGVGGGTRELYVPVKQESDDFVADFLARLGVGKSERLVAVNPAASCPSKLWPAEKFAFLIDRIQRELGVRALVVADAAHRLISEEIFSLVRTRPLDGSGCFSLTQLAGLFKRCELLVSNDSGPVHIAVAVGTPVISIFGRNQAGLSPRRWGPVGPFDAVLHKPMTCSPCLAHDCRKGFACLDAISVEDVMQEARRILGRRRA
ncbi:MAG: glycosyltransferase family 9 protein [Candidatus Omnitrophica bacterium]|nr:glycosyltransferase family 9 protein [Candidatus Omnitrophota bacterium]MDD5573915.1 glycosyltransferase family 9 protein [Candidatus Omnitrophota bacterium]